MINCFDQIVIQNKIRINRQKCPSQSTLFLSPHLRSIPCKLSIMQPMTSSSSSSSSSDSLPLLRQPINIFPNEELETLVAYRLKTDLYTAVSIHTRLCCTNFKYFEASTSFFGLICRPSAYVQRAYRHKPGSRPAPAPSTVSIISEVCAVFYGKIHTDLFSRQLLLHLLPAHTQRRQKCSGGLWRTKSALAWQSVWDGP